MMLTRCVVMAVVTAGSVSLYGQAPAAAPKVHLPSYIVPSQIDFYSLVPPPPMPGSEAQKADLAAVHAAEKSRTPAMAAAAKKDEDEEDIFIYATVLGPDFNAAKLPITAAFSAKLRNESGVVNPKMKEHFNRPRPYMVDSTLHPVCLQKPEVGYPSGHSSVGWITGLTLAEMVPEHAAAILERAQAYARNRVVCGVHYPTDVEASHLVALAMYGNMAASPAFQKDMAASRAEIRQALHMSSK